MDSTNYLISNQTNFHPEIYQLIQALTDKAWFFYSFEVETLAQFNQIINNFTKYYSPLEFSEIKEGDLILFTKEAYKESFCHAGRVMKKGKDINSTIVRSNFNGGIYEYTLNQNPKVYGKYVAFWRKK